MERTHWVNEILTEHEEALLRYARKLTGDPERALDLVQESFLKLCKQDKDHLPTNVKAWLFCVCRNLWVDQWRKERRMKTMDVLPEININYAEPQDALVKEEVLSSMLSALSDIPEKQQEVIRLKFQENFTYKEIANITGDSVSYIGVQIHAAIKTLRLKMKSENLMNVEA